MNIIYDRSISENGLNENNEVKIQPASYMPFWIFLIGSVLGFIIETIWRFAVSGGFEYHSSLMFAPITVIYGMGALLLYIGCRHIGKNRTLHIFVFGAAASTAIEYFSSLFQELIFGSVSWDYSDVFLNIGGRVCLTLSIIWGVLAVLWAAWIQPLFEKIILKIPERVQKPLTWVIIAFLILNAMISIAAVTRWGARLEAVAPTNLLGLILDRLFPDEWMVKFYPSMNWRN